MYIGKMKLTSADGHLTPVGYAWLEMGGADLVRYSGDLFTQGDKKYVMEIGHTVALMKIHHGPSGPEWRPTKKGRLRFREQNEWEVMIPAIGYAKDRHGNFHSFRDSVLITDKWQPATRMPTATIFLPSPTSTP